MTTAVRTFDIVIFGATGFSGRLLFEYLAKKGNAKLAIAGRNHAKLERVRAALAGSVPSAGTVSILIGDSNDQDQLRHIAEQTYVVASTVGPYAKYGTPLVEACARAGTSYCDLTGEADWHATMYNKFEKIASKTGARIIHQAGFDSVPSDVGAYVAAKAFSSKYGKDCERLQMFVSLRGGGVQGGTIATVINEIENGAKVRAEKRASRKDAPPLPRAGSTKGIFTKGIWWSPEASAFAVPFFMAGANTTYVCRSNGRIGYSSRCTYNENMIFPSIIQAVGFYVCLVVGGLMLVVPPTRWALQRWVLPAPGEGPSRAACEKASYEMLFCASNGDDRVDVKLSAVGDPSCISTTCCLAETALALSVEATRLSSPGGVMTAMAAAGDVLVERLRATPLFEITVVNSASTSKL